MLTRTRWPFPRILAHRGGGSLAPENTLVALRVSASFGFGGVEVDARLAADGVPVLLHDPTVDRTTTGEGALEQFTADELRDLDAGVWYGNEFAGEHVPTLEAAVALCRAQGQWMNVEVKAEGAEALETGAQVATTLARLWADTSPLPLVSSFAEAALDGAAEAAPTLPRALLLDRIPEDWVTRAKRLGCAAVHFGHETVTRALIETAHEHGFGVLAYTVNSPGRALTLFEWGIDGIVTDELRDIRPDFLSVYGLAP